MLVLKIVSALTLFTALLADAPLTTRLHRGEPFSEESRERRIYDSGLHMREFGGATWVIHILQSHHEQSPMGVTRFDSRGSRLFLAYEWLPPNSVPRGSVGQIYDVAPLAGGRIAAAVGYSSMDNESRNDIVILEQDGNGGYRFVRQIARTHARQLAPALRDMIVATTSAPTHQPRRQVTVFDSEGRALRELFPVPATMSDADVFQASWNNRVQHLGADRFAFYENHSQRVLFFTSDGTIERVVQVADAGVPVIQKRTSVDDVFVAPNGRITVVRGGRVNGQTMFVITVYEQDGRIRGFMTREPWRLVARAPRGIVGVHSKEQVRLETLELDDER